MRLECIGALLNATRGIVVRGFCEIWALLVNGDAHDAQANRVRCMKSDVKCSWRAHLTRVFTTSQVFPLARTTGECSSPKRSSTPAEVVKTDIRPTHQFQW